MKLRSTRFKIFPLIIALILLCNSQLVADDTSDRAEIVFLAKRLLSEFLSKADRDYLLNGGQILPEDDFELFEVGIPYQNYRIDPNKLAEISTTVEYQEALLFISWEIPVLYNTELRNSMMLSQYEGEWVLSRFGGDPSPMEYVRRNWPIADEYSHCHVIAAQRVGFISIQKEDVLVFYSYNEHNEAYLGLEKQDNGQYPTLSFDSFVGMIPVFIEVNENAFRIVD